MNASAFYEDKISTYSAAIASCKREILLSQLLRLGSFAGLATFGYFLAQHYTSSLLLLTASFLAVFIFFVKRGFKLKDKKALLEKLRFINTNEKAVLNDELNQMDSGQAFASHVGYTGDLDIFGSGSLYHLLNRCVTAHGKERLSSLLQHPILDAKEIMQRQEAVRQFADQPEQRQLLLAYGLLNEEEEGNLHSVSEWLKSGTAIHNNIWLQVARWAIPAFNVPALLVYIANGDLRWLIAGVAVGWIVTGMYAKYIHQQHQLLSKKQAVLGQYANILNTFKTVNPGNASFLSRLRDNAVQAYSAIGSLSKLSSLFDQRLNLLVNLFLNSIFLYDLQCILALEQWKARYKKDFDSWLDTVGDIECLNAIATFAFNNPAFAYPAVQQGTPVVETVQMAHPLIAAKERVANDFEAGKQDRLLLVTGSNMSGKTTFLRTLGVNLILAQNGAPVCAASFSFTPMEILSSIRVSDSLQEHTSYFMAELKRLQQIILQLREGRPSLVLIDEILRGTNSEDKTHGSEAFIEQLIQYNCLTLFATHDLSLSVLEETYPNIVRNYCFESIIQEDSLYFDYRLQKGVAKNRNATFLMKQMGIIKV